MSNLLRRVPDLAARARALATPLAPLLGRLCFGQMFVLTGLGKLANLDRTIAFFDSLGIPFASLQAPVIATLELVGGIALLAGLCTRTFAMLLASTMVVALLTSDGGQLLAALPFRSDVTAVAPVPPLVVFVWLAVHGGGRFSLDALIARRRGAAPAGRNALAAA